MFYQLLPFIEQENLYRMSDIVTDTNGNTNFRYLNAATTGWAGWPPGAYQAFDNTGTGSGQTITPGPVSLTPVKGYYCPSRRPAAIIHENWPHATTDYCSIAPGNIGSTTDDAWEFMYDGWSPGGDHAVIVHNPYGADKQCNFAAIKDGTSNVMAVTEKFCFADGMDGFTDNDDNGWAIGWDLDVVRSSGWQLNCPNPRHDTPNGQVGNWWSQFATTGSAHPAGINAVFADGSVHLIKFGVDPIVFNELANRDDGNSFSAEDIN